MKNFNTPLYWKGFLKNWIIKNKLKCIIKKKNNWIILKAVNPECACKGQYF